MDIWLIVLEVAFSIITTVLAFILKEQIKENKRLKREKEAAQNRRETALEEGVVCILRKHLMDEHEAWTAKDILRLKHLKVVC